jgi:hypothetical protein
MKNLTPIGDLLPNFFFLSFNDKEVIEHSKISIKFDNFDKGRARISIRNTLKLLDDSHLELYFLIKNDENPVTLEDIKPEYNEYLEKSDFLYIAGFYGLKKEKTLENCSIFKMIEFPENSDLVNFTWIHPREITCQQVRSRDLGDLPQPLANLLSEKDILIKISADNFSKIVNEVSQSVKRSVCFFFQFRVFLGNFVSGENLEYWKSSNKSWSIDFDLHKERGYEHFVHKLRQMAILKYPRLVELWLTIPHSHFFVASSPVYENAIRLKQEDIEYKTNWKEVGEFETREGDYAVRIMNKTGSFVEFSIICVSPFRHGEDPQELRRKIEDLKEYVKSSIKAAEDRFITWKEVATPLILMVTLLSLVVSVTVALSVRMEGYNETITTSSGRIDLGLLILSAVFTGVVVWAIAFSLSFATKKLQLRGNLREEVQEIFFPPNLAIAVIIVWMILYAIAILALYDVI